jgi:hypothetical protein
MVTCPPAHAWAVFPVSSGHSVYQAAHYFVVDHNSELRERLNDATRSNWATPANSGCAVVAIAALGVTGVMASAWALGVWGA